MENKIDNCKEPTIDPIGIEIPLAILGIAITTIGVVHQFCPVFKKPSVLKVFKGLDQEILKLQNGLDDFILNIERLSNQDSEFKPSECNLTISETLLDLRRRDYLRWLEIYDKIKFIDNKISGLASSLRQRMFQENIQTPYLTFDEDVISEIDDLLLNMSNMTFDIFIKKLRDLLQGLSKRLAEVLRESH